MQNIFILTLFISFIALMFLIAPIIIGVLIYKHASKHPMGKPLQWALICALTPLYLGLIIYMLKVDQYDTRKYDEEMKGK